MKHKNIGLMQATALLSGLAVCVSACKPSAATDADFASAPPDVKKVWEGASAAVKTNGYSFAILQLRDLRASGKLNPKQTEAVDQTMENYRDEMYKAAEKGDETAKKAAEELRQALGR